VARLRARAAQQEAKLIAEKSMIGRLHNKLAELNFERLRWEEGLEARDGALAAAGAPARAQARASRPHGSRGFLGASLSVEAGSRRGDSFVWSGAQPR